MYNGGSQLAVYRMCCLSNQEGVVTPRAHHSTPRTKRFKVDTAEVNGRLSRAVDVLIISSRSISTRRDGSSRGRGELGMNWQPCYRRVFWPEVIGAWKPQIDPCSYIHSRVRCCNAIYEYILSRALGRQCVSILARFVPVEAVWYDSRAWRH